MPNVNSQVSEKDRDDGDDITDVEEGATHWAILADKGYQELNMRQELYYRKKPTFGILTTEKKKNLGMHRVTIETFLNG